jgi:hypothetical protein
MKIDSLKNQKEIVTFWLENHPPTRDSDTKLVANIWSKVIGLNNLDTTTARGFLQMLVDGKMPSSETIRRTRQKVQEENPHLRGKSYRERQNRGASMRNDIKNL